MMTSEQQKLVDHDGEMFVTACPGAGKSTTVTERVRRIVDSLSSRQGVAILSFTNSAVETFKRKCNETGLDIALRYPFFVGTFDSFVRQFLILPGGLPNIDKRPILIDSWENLGVEIRITGSGSHVAIKLDKFDPNTNKIDLLKIGKKADRDVVQANLQKFESQATKKREQLIKKGYVSASDARVMAKRKLDDTLFATEVGSALKARFAEIIVDEAQDCNPDDLLVINWLRSVGIKVTVVSDPDQAIYEFRQGSPQDLRDMAQRYDKANVHSFTKNFRSAQIICDLAATLRPNCTPDLAEGGNGNLKYPIQLFFYPKDVDSAIGKKFVERVYALDSGISDKIVLSHKLKVAIRASGNQFHEDDSTSKVSLVCKAVSRYASANASPKDREMALRSIERLILSMMGKIDDEEHLEDGILKADISDRELRRTALDFLTSLQPVCNDNDDDKKEWLESFYKAVEKIGIKFKSGMSAKKFFPAKTGSTCFENLKSSNEIYCPCKKIHEVKGQEFDAVCIVIPKNRAPENYTETLIANWEGRVDDEAKRVIYVGATRAKKVLAIAIPSAYKARITKVLSDNNVSFESFDL
jgi:DNA helicase II / ATP-dependent DNA helicase PcrA